MPIIVFSSLFFFEKNIKISSASIVTPSLLSPFCYGEKGKTLTRPKKNFYIIYVGKKQKKLALFATCL